VKSTTSANTTDAASKWPVGDRAREDVGEQGLGLLLLDAERRQGAVALGRERGEDRERDRADTDDVQRQHRAVEPVGQIRVREEGLAGESRDEEDQHERDEPSDRTTHREEHQGAERRQDPPQRDASGRDEATDEHLTQRRRQEDGQQLDDEELPEVPRRGEQRQRADRDREVDERDDPHRLAEREIDAAPHDGHGQDQHGQQHEERLLVAELLVVAGIRADPGDHRGIFARTRNDDKEDVPKEAEQPREPGWTGSGLPLAPWSMAGAGDLPALGHMTDALSRDHCLPNRGSPYPRRFAHKREGRISDRIGTLAGVASWVDALHGRDRRRSGRGRRRAPS
jgi:hypothetical protein